MNDTFCNSIKIFYTKKRQQAINSPVGLRSLILAPDQLRNADKMELYNALYDFVEICRKANIKKQRYKCITVIILLNRINAKLLTSFSNNFIPLFFHLGRFWAGLGFFLDLQYNSCYTIIRCKAHKTKVFPGLPPIPGVK